MAISQLYPNQRPTLNLNFARSKTLDTRITFTRNSTATYVGSNGLIQTAAAGEERFDHDPETGESLGLLIEESRTNLTLHSEDFTNAAWTKDNITVSGNQAVAPDGTTTADLIYPSSTGNARTIYQNYNNANGTYTISCFVKAAGKNWVFIYNAQGNAKAWFNLSTGAKGSADATITDYGIVAYPNGWYRCDVRTDNTTARYIFIGPADGDNSTAATTSGTNGIYVWGAQFEEGSFQTSYIPTTSSTVTRAVDVASITGTNFSSWFNSSEGTFVARLPSKTPAEGFIADVGNNSTSGSAASGYILKYVPSSNNASGDSRVNDGSTALVEVSVTGSNIDLVFAYEENNFNTAVNGTLGTADTSGAVPTLGAQQVFLGSRFNSQVPVNTAISSFAYYNTRLTDTQIQALSR